MPKDSAIAAVANYTSGRRKLAVGVVALVLALDILDGTIVNVAVPSIQRGLFASDSAIQWVISGYSLCFALLLATAGRLGDILGYRPMFIIGVTGFTLASLMCGFAWSPGALIAGRVLEGIMAAMMAPQGMALIQVMYRPHERGAVMGIFGAVGGASAVLGPLVGGVLLHFNILGLGWRTIFLVNAPIGCLAVVAGLTLLPRGRSPHPLKPDFTGIAILLCALVLLTFPLVQGRELGWPAWIFLMLAASPAALALFWHHIKVRDALNGSALVPPALLHNRIYVTGLAMNLAFQLAFGGYLFGYTLMLQYGLRYSAIETALTMVPFAVAVAIGISLISRRLAARMGRRLVSLGMLTMAAGQCCMLGAFVLAVAPDGSVSLMPWLLIPCVSIAGLGMGMTIGPMAGIVLSKVEVGHAGSASGVLSSVQQLGLASGVAAIGSLFFVVVGPVHAGAPAAFAYAHGFEAALGCSIALLMCGFGASLTLPKLAYFRMEAH